MHNATSMSERILSRVTMTPTGFGSDCWISDRAAQPNGYTKINIDGRTSLVHRVAYETFVGPIPDGLQIDHLCRMPACCNPDHLEPVTPQENIDRRPRVTHCVNGHEYTPENTYWRTDRVKPNRMCRTCRGEASTRSSRNAAAA